MPSWVAFTEDGRWLVGDVVKRQAAGNTLQTLFNIKRIISQQYHECLDEIKSMPFKLVEHPTNGRPVIEVAGTQFQAEQISAMVLEEVKATAEAALGRTVKNRPRQLQRRPAPTHQGRRCHCWPGRAPHHQ
jgi:molecular chaperone DnaK (HSP70)